MTDISEAAVLNTHNVPFTITADVEVGDSGAEGVLAAIGGISSGWSLYVKDGKPTFYYNFFEVDHDRIQSSEDAAEGQVQRTRGVHAAGVWLGKPADREAVCQREANRQGRVEKTVPVRYSVEPFDVGRDTVSAGVEGLQSAVRVPRVESSR